MSLAATIGTDGTLAGAQTLYCGISAVDAAGRRRERVVVRRKDIDSGWRVDAQYNAGGLKFWAGAPRASMCTAGQIHRSFRIATDQAPASTFCDNGLAKQIAGPPDPNFDHANFYWRFELQTEYPATLHALDTVGNDTLEMPVNAYRGTIVRITRGLGSGQERAVLSNTLNTLSVTPNWDVEPDATSLFVVGEAAWRFGAAAKTSPVR